MNLKTIKINESDRNIINKYIGYKKESGEKITQAEVINDALFKSGLIDELNDYIVHETIRRIK